MKTTKKVADYVKEKGISTMKISKATGINHQILYNCFDKNTTRQLKSR